MHAFRVRDQLRAGAAMVLLSLAPFAAATELVYVPITPAFGGNNLAGQTLLATAQVTNKHKAPTEISPTLSQQDALKQFNDMLERAVLGQLASAATSSVFGPNGKLTPGAVETGNFRITITDLGGGILEITTTDKITGRSTSFQIGSGS